MWKKDTTNILTERIYLSASPDLRWSEVVLYSEMTQMYIAKEKQPRTCSNVDTIKVYFPLVYHFF